MLRPQDECPVHLRGWTCKRKKKKRKVFIELV